MNNLPSWIISGNNLKKNAISKLLINNPSTSASDAMIILLNWSLLISNLAPTLQFITVIRFVNSLRKKGFNVDSDLLNRSLKSQFKYADKIKAKYVLVIGDDEINENKISIKNMETGEQIKIWSNDVAEYLKQNV